MRPILANLITPNSLLISPLPLNAPGSSPLLRPISSPMTPITPLVLSDPTTIGGGAHYEKEDFFSHETGYFFHNHHEKLYTTSPYYYYTEKYYNDSRDTVTQPQVTVNIDSLSPLSSGATTPTITNPFNTLAYQQQAVNHYANHSDPLHYMNSHNQSYNNHTAPLQISPSGVDCNNYNFNYNYQFYDGNNNVNPSYDTLEDAYNQDDVQFCEMITGLSKMDIMDSH